ncbi:hypothetical protein PDESU_03283 [Pontiella desulfatans]|uniref:Uncharacterized protein n=1 Tax=Pontiella desulfatans TaxID=2750659 RepID=A0A6C2U490_PONDE|nr:PaaX family transcriptional regulator C-terminal domain-containing protein [Pontiella desulfatans]VGO14715.1 hypothetical protein PDESU_03283 [Pontiella desulfatans]
MKWVRFHHPDISIPVVRRKIALELMEMLQLSALFMTRGGWAVLNRSCYPDKKAYRNATYRLRKAGLVVHRKEEGPEIPRLELTPAAKESLPAYFNPEARWDKKWNTIWYMLVYDVPEADRPYRDVLRRFLKQERLGCLQQSVWVTPRDIRPQFDDLVKAAAVDSFAFLFESRTVLGLPNSRVADQAWNLDRLYDIQRRYCETTEQNLDLLAGSCSDEEVGALMRLALEAFHSAFAEDPLLPSVLLPRNYQGRRAWELHCRMMSAIGQRLGASN